MGSKSDLAFCIHREQLLHGPERSITPKLALRRGSPHHSPPEKLRPGENPCQVIDAAHFNSERIGTSKACGGVEHTAPRIGHCHLYELRIRRHTPNADIRLSHEMPLYSGQTHQTT